jgi:DHA1 family bicyclomycin/chloramphenicol resistance-like MFS transporter
MQPHYVYYFTNTLSRGCSFVKRAVADGGDVAAIIRHGERAMDQHTPPHLSKQSANQAPIGFAEFVALIASMMALTALGIDSMLPALPAIGESLGVSEPNTRQYVITAFLLGMAVALLVYGPLTDRFGRRPVLTAALVFYVVTSMLSAISGSFTLLLISRAAMGTAAAGARVTTTALVRDCFTGRPMARVMSLAMIIFMAAPVIAPVFGQTVLLFGSWRMIFWGTAACGLIVLVWFRLRLPETMPADARQSLRPSRIIGDYGLVLRDRHAVGYTIAAAATSGGMFGFVGSIQQIMEDVFHAPQLLTVVFAMIGISLACGAFLNSAIVMRYGMRLISHTALTVLTTIAGIHLAIALGRIRIAVELRRSCRR